MRFKFLLAAVAGNLLSLSVFAAPTLSTAPIYRNVGVHDPSVIKLTDGSYYIFGSHLAAAKTTDLKAWTGVAQAPSVSVSPLFNTYETEAAEGIEWTRGEVGSWAADVIQLNDGRYYFYYNHCGDCGNGTSRSYMGVAVSKAIEGPYKNLGVFLKTGQTGNDTPSTDIEGDAYTATSDPNAIDPDVFWGKDGKLWMIYGSYSGGIFVMEMNPDTGFPMKNGTYGTQVTGGNWSAIEGTHILYSPVSDYYYLFMSFGGFAQNDGYNMRIARSRNPEGPYLDAEGQNMAWAQGGWSSITRYGNKIMGGFNFTSELGMSGNDYGYMSPGHGSAIYDEELGKHLLFFHTRFPFRGEQHEVRVHEMHMTEDDWLVPLPHRYYGEPVGENVVTATDMEGTFQYINHEKDINRTVKESTYITFAADGNVTGALEGTYSITNNLLTITTLEGSKYKGVTRWQWYAHEKKLLPVFSAMNEKGWVAWGSKMPAVDYAGAVIAIADSLVFPAKISGNINLPKTGIMGATIAWQSSNPEVLSNEGVVTRPAVGDNDITVTLTATINADTSSKTKTFTITVLADSPTGILASYEFEDNLNDSTDRLGAGTTTGTLWNTSGGAAKFTTGLYGKALNLDGTYAVRLADNVITNYTYSISYWVKPTGTTPTYTTTFFGGNEGMDDNWVSYVPTGPSGVSGRTTLWYKTGNTYYDGDTGLIIPADKWTHLAFVVNQGSVEAYVDGVLTFSGSSFPDLFSGGRGDFFLGINYFSQDPLFKGVIDQFKAYDKALTGTEIYKLFENDDLLVVVDADEDGVPDNEDAFPNDPNETKDTDSDGIGDNADAFPNDPNESSDSDNDGVGDNADAFPNDANETRDSDGDGVGDNGDAYPNDPNETKDTDNDGMADNFEFINGLDLNDASDAYLDKDGDGVSNLDEFMAGSNINVDEQPPVFSQSELDDVVLKAQSEFTFVKLSPPNVVDALDGILVAVPSISGPQTTGSYQVQWTAKDKNNNQASKSQTLVINPSVQIAPKKIVAEGAMATISIELNGSPQQYPVKVPFTLSGSATLGEDFDVSATEFLVNQGNNASVSLTINDDGMTEGDETIIVTLAEPNQFASLSLFHEQTITITENPIKPSLSLRVSQNGINTRRVETSGGLVTLEAIVGDVNGAHSIDWSSSDNRLILQSNESDFKATFDPKDLAEGLYDVAISVADDGFNGQSFVYHQGISIVMPNQDEPLTKDDDLDGIADSIDAVKEINKLPAVKLNQTAQMQQFKGEYLLVTEPGLNLVIGDVALASTTAALVTESHVGDVHVREDDEADYKAGLFDIEIKGLSHPGGRANLVMPLFAAMPSQAVFRILKQTVWQDFIIDENNTLSSAAGMPGYCPSIGSAEYSDGLHQGDYCLLIKIQDGGPNDGDGAINGSIKNLGGVIFNQALIGGLIRDWADSVLSNVNITVFDDQDSSIAYGAAQLNGQFILDVGISAGDISIDISKAYEASERKITSADALAALKIAVGLNPNANNAEITAYQLIAADINGDGRVTSGDALAILKAAVGLASDYPPKWVFLSDDIDISGITKSNVITDFDVGSINSQQANELRYTSILVGNVNGK